jgi:hypothetical protein
MCHTEFREHKSFLSDEVRNYGIISDSLTNSMELKTTREATNHVATWQFPSILWNPKVYNRIHKSSPFVPILS